MLDTSLSDTSHFTVAVEVFTITEKAPTRAFSWLKAPSEIGTQTTDEIIIRDGRL